MIILMICSMLLLVSNMLSWIFRGREGAAAFYIVRISTFSTFLFGLIISIGVVLQYDD